jgi:type IV secretory pathway ATPase VirB11/archaellum biosynthesis ATPase
MEESNPLKPILKHYQQILQVIESGKPGDLSEIHALDVLMVRDRLQEILDRHSQLPPSHLLEIASSIGGSSKKAI